MKTAVVYNSQTGFTKRYAEWIAEETGADCFDLKKAKKKNMDEYQAIVFGGWACAGSISKLGWFIENMDNWTDKKLVAFCVGGSPMENPDISAALKQYFGEPRLKKASLFYCPGGLNYERMSVGSRLMMRMFAKMIGAKKEKTDIEKAMVKMFASSYDISDKKYIAPILECLKK